MWLKISHPETAVFPGTATSLLPNFRVVAPKSKSTIWRLLFQTPTSAAVFLFPSHSSQMLSFHVSRAHL